MTNRLLMTLFRLERTTTSIEMSPIASAPDKTNVLSTHILAQKSPDGIDQNVVLERCIRNTRTNVKLICYTNRTRKYIQYEIASSSECRED